MESIEIAVSTVVLIYGINMRMLVSTVVLVHMESI